MKASNEQTVWKKRPWAIVWRVSALILCFSCMDSGFATDEEWTKVWHPSPHLTNMAFMLAEHYAQYTLADREPDARGIGYIDGREKHIRLNTEMSSAISPWSVFGHAYTNYHRQCRAFAVKLEGNRFIPIIAVQHVLQTEEPSQHTGKGFAVYYNLYTGKVARNPDLFSWAAYSPAPPYHLTPPPRKPQSGLQKKTEEKEIPVDIPEEL